MTDDERRLLTAVVVELIAHRRTMDKWRDAVSAHTDAIQEWTEATRRIADVVKRDREMYDATKAVN